MGTLAPNSLWAVRAEVERCTRVEKEETPRVTFDDEWLMVCMV